MTGWRLDDDPAVIGGRIRQARRELGLTQADLAARIGVSLGVLDRFETGKGDPSDKLEQIAEVTARPVSWYTSTEQYEAGIERHEAGLTAELQRRLAASSGHRPGPADAEITEQTGPADRAKGSEDPVAARAFEDLSAERTMLVQQQHELQAALAVEREEHAARANQMAEELERVNANQQALAEMLEQSESELAASRARGVDLSEPVGGLRQLELVDEHLGSSAA